MRKRIIVVVACVGSSAIAWGQQPGLNLVIADRPGEQVQPKLVSTADGGAYVSWFDNATGGYDVYLQLVSAQGVEQWPHNGVLVADRSFSSTQDYGLSLDASGNALLTFRDDRFVGEQITAAKVDPSGVLVWGASGVQLTNDTVFHAAPGIAGTTDGGAVVAWTNGSDVKVQKLDGSGAPQWGAGLTLTDAAGGEYLFSDIHAADAGSVIVSWNRQPGFLGAKHIYAQKLDASGVAQWNGGSPVVVFDGGSLQFGNFPEFVHDGSGGAVFGWYSSSPSLQCYAQHILADGSEAFGHNGSIASTNGAQLRVSPDVAYSAGSGETFLFWTETNGSQSMFGVMGQKFDALGARQWSDTGAIVNPLSSTERTFVNTITMLDGAVVSFIEGSGSSKTIQAARLDGNGNLVWMPSHVTVSTAAGDKSRLAMAKSADGLALLVWQDGGSGTWDIYGQNVNEDGLLGGPICAEDLDGSGAVDVLDLLALLALWGTDPGGPPDFNGDGTVDVLDLLALIAAWGPCL